MQAVYISNKRDITKIKIFSSILNLSVLTKTMKDLILCSFSYINLKILKPGTFVFINFLLCFLHFDFSYWLKCCKTLFNICIMSGFYLIYSLIVWLIWDVFISANDLILVRKTILLFCFLASVNLKDGSDDLVFIII